MFEQKKIDSLIRNEWEFYDVKKMMKIKITILLFILVVFGGLFFVLSGVFLSSINEEYNTVFVKLGISLALLIVILLVSFVKLKQMDMDKKGWYFSAFQDKRLKREDVLGFAKELLKENNILFEEEQTKRTITLWITIFNLLGKDFRIRVWFSKVDGVPILELGIGPESLINKGEIEKFKRILSDGVRKRYEGS